MFCNSLRDLLRFCNIISVIVFPAHIYKLNSYITRNTISAPLNSPPQTPLRPENNRKNGRSSNVFIVGSNFSKCRYFIGDLNLKFPNRFLAAIAPCFLSGNPLCFSANLLIFFIRQLFLMGTTVCRKIFNLNLFENVFF